MNSRRVFLQSTAALLAAAPLAQPAPNPSKTPDRIQDLFLPPVASSLDGILGARAKVNIELRLLEGVNTDALLEGFRHRPGVQTWVGEHIGKFIDAATTVLDYTDDKRLERKTRRCAN